MTAEPSIHAPPRGAIHAPAGCNSFFMTESQFMHRKAVQFIVRRGKNRDGRFHILIISQTPAFIYAA